jgi:hypothetical protein
VIGRTASQISSSLPGVALVISIVGLAPVVGSFSEARFVSGQVQLRIHLLFAIFARGNAIIPSRSRRRQHRTNMDPRKPRDRSEGQGESRKDDTVTDASDFLPAVIADFRQVVANRPRVLDLTTVEGAKEAAESLREHCAHVERLQKCVDALIRILPKE